MRREKYYFIFIAVFIFIGIAKADDAAGLFPKLNSGLEAQEDISDILLDNLTTSQIVAVTLVLQDNFSLEGDDEMPSEKSLSDEALGLLNKDAIFLKYNKKF